MISICKLIPFVSLLLAGPVMAQSEFEQSRLRAKMWDNSSPETKITAVPEKWKKESAVILFKDVDYTIGKDLLVNYLHENMDTRTRIKVLDKAAVQNFSELSFDNSQSYQYGLGYDNDTDIFVGIKVIKPDGREVEVKVDNTAVMEIKQGYARKQYKKIAIPDLEPGDIIDYYYCVHKNMPTYGFSSFSPVMYTLANDYPTVKQRLDLLIQRKCYLNAKSVNGAPELQPAKENDRNEMLYTLVDSAREKEDAKRWLFPYRSSPTLKLQAFYAQNRSIIDRTAYASFIGKQGVVKTSLTEAELSDYVNERVTSWPSTGSKMLSWFFKVLSFDYSRIDRSWAHDINVYLKRNFPHETDPEKLTREAYYYFRQMAYARNFEGQVIYEQDNDSDIDDYVFVRNMSRVLEKHKIPHEVILTTSREVSSIKEIVLPVELTMLIRVNNKEKHFYLANFSRFSNYNDLDPEYQGNDALAVNVITPKKARSITQHTIPVMPAAENADVVTLEASFDPEDMTQLRISRDAEFKGANRFYEQEYYLTPYDYLQNCRADKYKIKPLTEAALPKRKLEELQTRIEQHKQEASKNREDGLKNRIEEDFAAEVISMEEVKVKQPGIWDDAPAFNCSDKFKLEGLVRKVGTNYLLDAGRLIGEQLELEKKEMQRQHQIFMPYARSFNYTIKIAIPEGYAPKGLEKLNYNTVNSTGGFNSTARIEGSHIVITTNKYYASNYEEATKWPDLVNFLEASYDFTQQKILFKKL